MFGVARSALIFLLLAFLPAEQAFAYSGDTIQDDIAREFSGGPSSYTIPLSATAQPAPSASQPTCYTTLQQEMSAGEIPSNESCYCPVGATQPVCTAYPGGDCQTLLQDTEERLGSQAQYYDCSCASSSATPQCTSYYQLCETNLPSYQNSTNECTCSQTATSAIPACTSDYSICESNASRYESSNTNCACSQTSTQPYCCTAVQSPITGEISYSGTGNGWTITGGTAWSFTDPGAAHYGLGYTQTIQYDPFSNTFSGNINISGTVQVGYVCGGNSGLYGSGNELLPLNQPNDSSCSQPEPESSQTATGTPIQLSNTNGGGVFSGGPITVNEAWGSFIFEVDPSNDKCIEGLYTAAGGYENLGTLCTNNSLSCETEP
jgi:hypothetical protein